MVGSSVSSSFELKPIPLTFSHLYFGSAGQHSMSFFLPLTPFRDFHNHNKIMYQPCIWNFYSQADSARLPHPRAQ